VALDWGNRANITIVIAAAAIIDVVSGTIVAGEAIITVDSIVGV
jgi:adenine deaminase